jgi:1-acyl-sn-glycerol-3-phosphate acyltransferase
MDVWYNTAKAIVGAYVSLFIQKMQVMGKENIPPGAKIVVGNHALASDVFLLPFILPDKVHYLVQSEIFTVPIVGKFLAMADQIPVVRGRGQEALEMAKQKLAKGATIVMFPEGKLNNGVQLLRAYTGAARLALETNAPVLPVGFFTPPQYARPIVSHFFGRRTYGAWQFGGPSFITIGDTWRPPAEEKCENPMQYLRTVHNVTEDIMGRINSLVDQARGYAANWFPSVASHMHNT